MHCRISNPYNIIIGVVIIKTWRNKLWPIRYLPFFFSFLFLSSSSFSPNSLLFHSFILFLPCSTLLYFVFWLVLFWHFHPMFDFMSLGEPRDFLISFILKFASAHFHRFPQFYLRELAFCLIAKIFNDYDEKLCDSKEKKDVCKDRKYAYKSIISCKMRIKVELVFEESIEGWKKRKRKKKEWEKYKKRKFMCEEKKKRTILR